MCVAQRERSASAARAQRELSAPAPSHEYANTKKPVARAAEQGAAAAAAAAFGTPTHPRTEPVATAPARRVRQVRVETTREPAPPTLVPACAAAYRRMRNLARAMARRAVAAHPHVGVRPRNTRVWRVTREGDPPPPHFPACGRVRACAARSRRRPASSDRARLLGAGPPRPIRPIVRAPLDRTWREGGEERRHFTSI